MEYIYSQNELIQRKKLIQNKALFKNAQAKGLENPT